MAKPFPLNPKHPERICWGCDLYCPADSMKCGNGSNRTQHPCELLGDDWHLFGGWSDDDTTPTERTASTPDSRQEAPAKP